MARVWLSVSRKSMDGTKRFRETSSSILKRNFYTYRDRAGGVFCIENSYSFDETSLFRLCIPRSTRWKRHARGEVRRERESTWLLGKQSR